MSTPTDEPNISVSRDEMLAIKETVRSKLIHELHAYQMTARLHRRLNNTAGAQMDEARVKELRAMIKHLEDEDEPAHGTSIRLKE